MSTGSRDTDLVLAATQTLGRPRCPPYRGRRSAKGAAGWDPRLPGGASVPSMGGPAGLPGTFLEGPRASRVPVQSTHAL